MRHFRLFLYLVVGLLLGSSISLSYAAQVSLTMPSNVARVAGGGFSTAGSAAFNGLSFNSAMTTQVAGRAVTVPASWRLAANAGQFAVAAVRLNPYRLIGGAVIVWLASEGIQYLNDQFQSGEAIPDGYVAGYRWAYGSPPKYGRTPEEALAHFKALQPAYSNCVVYSTTAIYVNYKCYLANGGSYLSPSVSRQSETCPAGSGSLTINGVTSCAGVGGLRPTTDADWNRLAVKPLPDPVASDLAAAPKSVPLPLEKPVVDPTPIDVPLSDPRIDPKTGKRVRDVARVTPQPSTPDRADVQVSQQDVDAAGNPAIDPATGNPVAPSESSDLCRNNPDILACQALDTPAAPDITEQNKDIVITPDSGWGPDSGTCPADIVKPLHGGVQYVQSWQPVCFAVTTFRPAILAVAWFSAVLIALGIYRSSN